MRLQKTSGLSEGRNSVFFDAAGTLFEVRGSVGEIYARIAATYGVQANGPEVDRAFASAFRARTLRGLGNPDGDYTDAGAKHWWFDVVEAVFRDRMSTTVLHDYFNEVFEFFRSKEAWVLFPETVEAIKRLRACGRRLGIISNFDSRLLDVLTSLGIAGFFDSVTLSWRVGAAKPDGRIFDAALRDMGITRAEAVHIGDSATEDFAGARGAGLAAILLQRRGSCSTLTPCARDLLEVSRLLGCGPSRRHRVTGCSRSPASKHGSPSRNPAGS